jgi:DNA-binding response OmpR family regulator
MLLKPDLILVDLRLPGMSGVEICKQLRAAHVVTPDHRAERAGR